MSDTPSQMEIFAAGAAPASGSGLPFDPFLLMLVAFAVLMYFLLIRPQNKRARQHREMVEALAKDDEIVTNGGLVGRIRSIGEEFLLLEVGQGVEVRLQRNAVAKVLPRGTVRDAKD